MDDILGKIGELLSDEESMKQLSELAEILMNETSQEENNRKSDNENNNDDGDKEKSPSLGFDLTSLLKLRPLLDGLNQKDKNTDLLLALKPHLSEEKSAKADKAVKLLKVLALWSIIKESGLLKDFL